MRNSSIMNSSRGKIRCCFLIEVQKYPLVFIIMATPSEIKLFGKW